MSPSTKHGETPWGSWYYQLDVQRKRWADHVVLLYEKIGGSRSLAKAIQFRYGGVYADGPDWDPNIYLTPVDFARAWQAERLLSKCDFLTDPGRARQAAISSFLEAEESCWKTNRRLAERSPCGRAGRILRLARKMISELIGESPQENLEDIFELAEWGRGATSSCKGRFTQRYNKLGSDAEYTADISIYLPLLKGKWWWPEGPERVIPGNKIDTVPKTYKTDRTIAVEPTVNSAVQRGVGRWLQARLRRWSVDTRDQTRNQRLARKGSVYGAWSTIDMSMASDLISRASLLELLPPDWCFFLDTLRSRSYFLDGKWYYYGKHSSMGNGYTFELESLLFASIVKACAAIYDRGTPEWAVYGDDLVVPRRLDPFIRGTLRAVGFRVNRSKSFRSGLFRESCGEEFYGGVRCTPYYVRKWGETPYAFADLCNFIRTSGFMWTDRRAAWLATFFMIPNKFRLKGCPGAPGTVWVNTHEVPDAQVSIRSGRIGWLLTGVLFDSMTRPLEGPSAVVEAVRRAYEAPVIEGLCNTQIRFIETRENVARRSGRWVRRPIFVEDWPVLPDL